MTTDQFKQLYEKEIDALVTELGLYENEALIWKIENNILNSAGNLVLHLAGNLDHFIGATLGNTGYVRDRDAEFSDKNVSRDALVKRLHEVKATVVKVLDGLTAADLAKEFPFDKRGKQSTEFYLMYFLTHFTYHLGQVNYHRRLILA